MTTEWTPDPSTVRGSPISNQDERELVDQLTTAALSEHLPEELDLYLAGRQQYLDERGTISTTTTKEEATGFGAEILVALTPYFVAAATAAVKYVAGLLGDALKDEAKPLITRYVRRLFHLEEPTTGSSSAAVTPPQPAAAPPLPSDTIGRVHEVVLAFCREHRLAESDSALVADAIAGRLALPA